MADVQLVRRVLRPCAAFAVLLVAAACGGGGEGEPVRKVGTVTVSSATSTMHQGDAVQLTAVARDEDGHVVPGGAVAWSVSDPAVASISPAGRLQALAGGAVIVTATTGGARGWAALVVWPFMAESVTIGSPTAAPLVGDAVPLTAVVRSRLGVTFDSATAAWSTSDSHVAVVTPTGLLQALAPGDVVVTATAYGASGAMTLTVSPRLVTTVTVSAPTLTPKEGDAVQLTATARDQAGNVIPDAPATWSSSDANIATVSPTGVVQTLATGTVVVSATVSGVSGSQSLTISPIRVSVTLGAREVVFTYATDRCHEFDTPDQPPRMVRAEDGSLVLFAGNAPRTYVSRGADFGSLKRDCSQPVLVSADRRTPESYENQEWIWVVYREGNRWHALVHNEYHDAVSATCLVGDTGPANPCWYNSMTHAVSTDSARSFLKPSAPAHVIAPAPNFWVPPPPGTLPGEISEEGYFAAGNIVRGGDGFFYTLIGAVPSKVQPSVRGLCPIRTDNLDDPSAWRAWDGGGYNLRMTSPYVTGSAAPICTSIKEVGPAAPSFTYNTYLGRYMRFGNGGSPGTPWPCGFYFTLSSDLIHWSDAQLVVEASLYECQSTSPSALEQVHVRFPALIDHGDTTINFERPGRTVYLYYARFNRKTDDPLYWSDRDVVRVPITFTRID